jgi:Fe-S cluster biosynthesis and repair protein YggX
MTRWVQCAKLHQQLEGLDQPPFPNEMGQKIYEHISQTAWEMWLNHQTMLINEYRLSMLEPQSRTFIMQEMEKFLFEEGRDLASIAKR